MVTGTIRIY